MRIRLTRFLPKTTKSRTREGFLNIKFSNFRVCFLGRETRNAKISRSQFSSASASSVPTVARQRRASEHCPEQLMARFQLPCLLESWSPSKTNPERTQPADANGSRHQNAPHKATRAAQILQRRVVIMRGVPESCSIYLDPKP